MYGPPGSYHVTGQQQLSLICGEVGRPHEAPKLGTFHRLLLTSAPVSAQSRLWLVLQTQPHILDVCEGREGPLLRPRPVPHPTQLCFVCTHSFVLVRDPRQPVKVLVREKRAPHPSRMYVRPPWAIPQRKPESGRGTWHLCRGGAGKRASPRRGWACTQVSGYFLLCNVFHFHISLKLRCVLGSFPKQTDSALDTAASQAVTLC